MDEPDSPRSDGNPLPVGRVVPVNDASFANAVLDHPGLTVAVFTAAWCGSPWTVLSPVLDDIAATEHDYLRVAVLDIDESPATARQYMVRAVPALLLFKNHQRVEDLIGAIPKRTIMNAVRKHHK